MIPRCLCHYAQLQGRAAKHAGESAQESEFVHRIIKDTVAPGGTTVLTVDFGQPIGGIRRFEIEGIHPSNIWGIFLSNVSGDDFNINNYIADPKAYPETIPFVFGNVGNTTYIASVPKRSFRYIHVFGFLKLSNLEVTIDMHFQYDPFFDGFDRGQIRQFVI